MAGDHGGGRDPPLGRGWLEVEIQRTKTGESPGIVGDILGDYGLAGES